MVEILIDLDLNNSKILFEHLIKEAIKKKKKNVLVDLRKVKISFNIIERFFIGEFLAEKGRFLNKIACIVHEEH